jgi:prevent-host-death family protein
LPIQLAAIELEPIVAFLTISSHNVTMKTANISELKAKLSAYLAEVRRGGTVLVYDRSVPIARLVPFQEEADDLVVIEASAPPSDLKRIKGVRPKKRVDLDRLLRESRSGR